MVNRVEIYHLTTENRLMIADILDTLDDAEWHSPTLCTGWTVGHMAAHFVQPILIGFPRFLLTAMRYRGDKSDPWVPSPRPACTCATSPAPSA